MFIEQIYTTCLAQASYYIESNGEVAIIDPIRDPGQYIELAATRGAKIKYIFETHFHADFVSGHQDLSKITGAPIVFGPGAETGYEIIVGKDEQEFALGEVSITLLHSPGHTMESSCYLLKDSASKAHAIFTGDTLFVGDVGRPDLLDGVISKEVLASHMYASLNKNIMPLADEVIVYPGHGPGSSCGKCLGPETWSTIGNEKKSNYALQQMSEPEFIDTVTANLKAPPPYFFKDASINKNGSTEITKVMEKNMKPLSIEDFQNHIENGAIVLDTRCAEDFEQGFIKGAINIGLGGMFAIWVGTVIEHGRPILVVSDPGKEEESISRLARVGYDDVPGYLDGGQQAWEDKGLSTDTVDSITAEKLSEDLGEDLVLDVRREAEYEEGHLENAYNIPLSCLDKQMSDVKSNHSFYIHCKSGYRSMTAASILKRNGISNVINVSGGMDDIAETSLKIAALSQ